MSKATDQLSDLMEAGGHSRLDATESIYFDRQLEQIKNKTYEPRYVALKARQFIPPSPEPIPVGASTWTARIYDTVGSWKFISAGASDIPRVDLKATEFSGTVYEIANAFGWTLRELEAARFARKDLSGDKARAARKVIEEALDQILSFGETDLAMYGLLNQPLVSVVNVPTSLGGATLLSALYLEDPNLVITAFTDVDNVIRTFSKEIESADTLLLPPTIFRFLSQNQRSNENPRTLLEELRAKLPGITTIAEWQRLETAGVGGVPRAMFYRRDPEYVYMEEPMPFTIGEPLRLHLAWEVVCRAQVGGVIMIYPASARYLDFV